MSDDRIKSLEATVATLAAAVEQLTISLTSLQPRPKAVSDDYYAYPGEIVHETSSRVVLRLVDDDGNVCCASVLTKQYFGVDDDGLHMLDRYASVVPPYTFSATFRDCHPKTGKPTWINVTAFNKRGGLWPTSLVRIEDAATGEVVTPDELRSGQVLNLEVNPDAYNKLAPKHGWPANPSPPTLKLVGGEG